MDVPSGVSEFLRFLREHCDFVDFFSIVFSFCAQLLCEENVRSFVFIGFPYYLLVVKHGVHEPVSETVAKVVGVICLLITLCVWLPQIRLTYLAKVGLGLVVIIFFTSWSSF